MSNDAILLSNEFEIDKRMLMFDNKYSEILQQNNFMIE